MNSLESVTQQLQIAATALGQAADEMDDWAVKPAHSHNLREALGNIVQIQQEIDGSRHSPPPTQPDAADPDPDLTREEAALVNNLSDEELGEIDAALLSFAKRNWRKVAMLVALAMARELHQEGIPGAFYSQRVRKLVGEGRLLAQGDLHYMRFSEVRLPDGQ